MVNDNKVDGTEDRIVTCVKGIMLPGSAGNLRQDKKYERG